jgi:phage/plasmid-like protein (TIGR03299 family)
MENLVAMPTENSKALLVQANLDWAVESRPLITSGENPIESEHIAIVRTDTNKILGVHKSSYTAYQNSEMAEILDRISGKMGLPLHRGGYFGEGQKTFIQLKTTDHKLGTDEIKGYLTCVNSFDGSTSLAFGHSNVTISCQNTFFASIKDLNNKVRHTSSMHGRVDLICLQIEEVLRQEALIYNKIDKMAQYEIAPEVREMVLGHILNLQKEERIADVKSLSTRKQNVLSDLQVNIHGEIVDKGENLWGLFSGITKYTTHSLKGDSTENKLFGVYGNREREVFNKLAQMV